MIDENDSEKKNLSYIVKIPYKNCKIVTIEKETC